MPGQIHKLTNSLGFCCLYAFFRAYKRTGMIATRLGMSRRAIGYWKARFVAGELQCEKCEGCLLKRLRAAGR